MRIVTGNNRIIICTFACLSLLDNIPEIESNFVIVLCINGQTELLRMDTPMLPTDCKMDMSGIEPDPSRMLSERDNQLHHMPLLRFALVTCVKRSVNEWGTHRRSSSDLVHKCAESGVESFS